MSSQYFFLTCASLAVFTGIPANVMVLVYFVVGDKILHETTKLLYIAIVSTDLLIAVCLIPYAVEHLGGFELETPNNGVLCEIMEFNLDTLIRLSYLNICLLAIFRTRTIRNPLVPSKIATLKRFMIGAVLFLAIQSLIPIIARQIDTENPTSCEISMEGTFRNPLVRKAWLILTVFLEAVAAMIVMMLANGVSIYYLLKRTYLRKDFRVKAATTTLTLTMVFFCLHFPGVIYVSCKVMGVEIKAIDPVLANAISVSLTPVVEPMVYFLRVKGVWQFWVDLVFKILNRLGRLQSVPRRVLRLRNTSEVTETSI